MGQHALTTWHMRLQVSLICVQALSMCPRRKRLLQSSSGAGCLRRSMWHNGGGRQLALSGNEAGGEGYVSGAVSRRVHTRIVELRS